MLIETTVNKLHEMRLSTMARAFKEQLSDPSMASMDAVCQKCFCVTFAESNKGCSLFSKRIASVEKRCYNFIRSNERSFLMVKRRASF